MGIGVFSYCLSCKDGVGVNISLALINSVQEIVAATVTAAQQKVRRSLGAEGVLSVLGGIYIAMGGLLSVLVGYGMPSFVGGNPVLPRLLSGMFFPLGLILVVFLGAELFTGNNATLMPGTLRGDIPRWYFLRNWLVVYIGNFAGAVFFTYFFSHLTGMLAEDPWRGAIVALAERKVRGSFGELFLKGVGANWFVCLAVWLGMASRTVLGRMLGLWMPVMAFVTMGFEHSIANMFFIPAGMFEGAGVTLWQFAFQNLLPVTLGNIVGGAVFVGGVYWWVTPVGSRCD